METRKASYLFGISTTFDSTPLNHRFNIIPRLPTKKTLENLRES